MEGRERSLPQKREPLKEAAEKLGHLPLPQSALFSPFWVFAYFEQGDSHRTILPVAPNPLVVPKRVTQLPEGRHDDLAVLAFRRGLELRHRAVDPSIAMLQAIDEIMSVLAFATLLEGER